MAIKGLTGKGMKFQEIGKLFKGAPKQKKVKDGREYEVFGRDLDHWRFESPIPEIKEAFIKAFGDKPRELFVYLPFAKTEENLQTCKEAYTAGALQHRCDGETCSLWLDPATNEYRNDPIPCPTLEMKPDEARRNGCKNVARLSVVIPALNELGFVTVETHSKHDICFLDGVLPAFEGLQPVFGLKKIPFLLYRYEKEISTPQNGKRVRVAKWLVGIKPMSEWSQRYLSAQSQALLNDAIEIKMLAAGDPDIQDDEENDDETEQLCSPETAAAITELWTVHGAKNKAGQIIPLPEYLKSKKGVDSLAYLPADSAQKLLAWLQERALPAAQSEQKFGWVCDDALAAEIEALTKDLVSDGVTDDQWQAELAEFMGQDRTAKVDLSTLTNEQAFEWIRVLKSWVTSRGEVAEAA